MSDSTSLALLMELVSNPLMMSNYILYTGNPEDLDSIAKDDPQLAEWIKVLGRTLEAALIHLRKHGVPVDHLTCLEVMASEMMN